LKDNSSKVLLVGPSYKIADYDLGYFEDKRREGYKIVSYTGSILYFREIGFAPDYFSWIDPTSVLSQSWNAITESGDLFKNTDMLAADLFKNNAAAYREHRLITTTSMNEENCKKINEELPKFFNKCHWHKVRLINSIARANSFKELREKHAKLLKIRPRKARELQKKIRRIEAARAEDYKKHGFSAADMPDFRNHLYLIRCDKISGHVSISVDKLTSFVLPLILHHFGDSLNEIRILGFGDFEEKEMGINVGRYGPGCSSEDIAVRQEERIRTMSSFKFLFGHYYFDLLQEEKIKLLFENENSYSRTLEGLSSIFAKASPEMKALILESWKG
jgi:hypothetical protein